MVRYVYVVIILLLFYVYYYRNKGTLLYFQFFFVFFFTEEKKRKQFYGHRFTIRTSRRSQFVMQAGTKEELEDWVMKLKTFCTK